MKKGYFYIFLTAIISGFSVFINKFGVSAINPYLFTGLKNLTVACVFTGIVLAGKNRMALKQLSKKQWLWLVFIGLIGGSIPFLLFFKGLSLTTAGEASFIHKTLFVYTAIFAAFLLKEKINKKFIIGSLLLMLGNVLLLKKLAVALDIGDLLIFGAAVFWALESVVSKYLLKDIEANIVGWARMFFGAIFIFLFLAATGQVSSLAMLNGRQIYWVLTTAVLLGAYVLTWYNGLKYVPVSAATAILFLGSPITIILDLFITGKITLAEIGASIAIICGSAFIVGFGRLINKNSKRVDIINYDFRP